VNEVHVWDRIAVAPDGSERAEPVPARRHRWRAFGIGTPSIGAGADVPERSEW